MKKVYYVQNTLGEVGVFCPISDALAEAIELFEQTRHKLYSGGIASIQMEYAIGMLSNHGERYEQRSLRDITGGTTLEELISFCRERNLLEAAKEVEQYRN